MSTGKKKDEELEKQKKQEAQAAADAERIKADGGVWKVTLEDQAKYAAEHAPKKSAAQTQQSGGSAAISQQAAQRAAAKAVNAGEDYDPRFGRSGQQNSKEKKYAGASIEKLKKEYAAKQDAALQSAYDEYTNRADTAQQTLQKQATKRAAANKFDSLREEYAAARKAEYEREVKQAREDEARNALFKEQALAKKSAENVKNANSSALDKARRAKADSGNSAADFVQSRSERMGKLAIGDPENVEKIKNRDLKSEIGLEWEKIKYQWEEAGRRYDALSDEEKQALYRRRNSSALDRARTNREENSALNGRTAQETRNNVSNWVAQQYEKMDEESRDPAKAQKYAFINRVRSAAGTGAENMGLWLYETLGYEPGKKVYDAGEARAISEVTDEQVQRLMDAAPSQLGKDLVKVSDSVAQQLSYKILTAPISLFAGSVIPEKIYETTGNLEKSGKAAHDITGGVYTGGMAMSSAADKYVEARAEGQSKLEASVRAVGTGMISYFSEALGGIGGSKSPLGKLEEKAGEKLITSILYNAFEEGGEEFVEYAADFLLDGAADMVFKGEWQQEWSWEEVIENAKIGAMTGGLFGGYQKLMNKIYTGNPEVDAQLDRAARAYADYMVDAYRLQSDPELRAIAERQMGETTIPSATRTRSGETGEMNYGSVFEGNAAEVQQERIKYSLSAREVSEIKKGVSVITDADNNTVIDIKTDILKDIPKNDWLKRVKNVIRSVFPKGFNLNGEHIDVSAKSRGEFVKSKDSVYLRDKNPEIYRDKMETAPHLDVISQNTEFQNVAPDHERTDNIVSFDKGRVNLKIGENDYSAEVVIGVRDDGSKVFYDIVGMDANKRRPPSGSQSAQTANTRAQEPSDNISSDGSISNFPENVNTRSKEKPGTVSAEEMYGLRPKAESKPGEITDADVAKPVDFKSMYGVDPDTQRKNGKGLSFEEWAEQSKKQAQIDGERVNALSLKERLTMIFKNKFPNTLTHVKLGEMPGTIKATIGTDSNAPLIMSRNKAYEAMTSKDNAKINEKNKNANWHKLGDDGLEKVINALDNPLRAIKQENGRYGFVVEIEKNGEPFYAVIELDTEGNYRGKMDKANVVVSAFGTNLNYIENQVAKGVEIPIKKESNPASDLSATIAQGINETDSSGDVPTPETNIPQNGNGVNSENRVNLEKAVDEAKKNAVTDEELKKKRETEREKILERRIQKAGLDMGADEIVDFAQAMGHIKGFFGSEMKDFARIFDDVASSKPMRNKLHELFEKPHREAQAQYTQNYKNAVKDLSEKFSELGIKAGTKESSAVQRIGEGVYQIDSKGTTAPYTIEMLKRDFPNSWQNIEAAAKYSREVYDGYLKRLNEMFESIYPQTVEKAEERKTEYNAAAQRADMYRENLLEVRRELSKRIDAKKESLSKKKGETTVKADLRRQIATLEARMKAVDSRIEAAQSRAFAARTKSELLRQQIESGEILKNRQIKPRKDYFRHFQEIEGDFSQITDLFTNDQNISPDLIGKSEGTKPRAMWTSIAQTRAKTHAYTEDAVGGLLKYTQAAETLLAYDPLISQFRDTSAAIRTAAVMADEKVKGSGTNAGKFAAYLDDWTNNIAGKTYALDRFLDKSGRNGRAVLKAIDKINGNVKGSMVMANVNTALKQISNVPNATAYILNPGDWAKGAAALAEAKYGKGVEAEALREARSQSSFMNERFLDDDIGELTKAIEKGSLKSTYKKFEGWLISAGDKAGAELIWQTAYSHYLENPESAKKLMGRDYDSAIDYADDITRRSVAGRGRGETALAETSKIMGLIAPFQVETNNSYQLLKEQIGKKNAAGVIALQVNTFLLNTAFTAAIGSNVLGFDFIQATIDVIKNAFGIGKEDDEDKSALDIAEYTIGRYAGELLSGMPLGAQIGEIITAGDADRADKWFGESNPAKFGNGIAAISSIDKTADTLDKAARGRADAIDVFDAVSPFIGRRQYGRTAKGLRSMIEGGSYGYDSDGKRYLKFAQGNGAADWVKAILMGEYATDAGREYLNGGFKSLSTKDTEKMKLAENMGVSQKEFYAAVLGMKKQGSDKEKQKWLFESSGLLPEQKRIIDALYFGNLDDALAAVREENHLSGGKTDSEKFYKMLSGELSAKRDYSGSYAFENSGYNSKTQVQIRKANSAGISRERLLDFLKGTKGKPVAEKMESVYSEKDLSDNQKNALADIVTGSDGKKRRESYAAANVSMEDRANIEGLLASYEKTKKQSGDETKDAAVKKEYIISGLMSKGKSEHEAYKLYKVQDGSWANSVADLSDKEQKRAAAAKKAYGLSEEEYVKIKNYGDIGEGKKDKYGNTVSGSKKEDLIKNLASILQCSTAEAERKYAIATSCVYSVEDLSSSNRDKLETAKSKYGWTDEKWLEASNAVELSGASKKDEKIAALRKAGFSATEATGFYNLSAGNDYYKASGSSTPYGLNSVQYDKTKYYSEKNGKSEKEVASYFKAIKGLRKKADIIAALQQKCGLSSSEAEAFYKLRQGHDSGYKEYQNGG